MSIRDYYRQYRAWLRQINGSTLQTDISEYEQRLEDIRIYEAIYRKQSDQQLLEISRSLQKRARYGEDLDELLPMAFALVYIAFQRTLDVTPFDVQLVGAIALYKKKLVQMQTGEGKTFTAVFPAYLNALAGEGVHILTFNDYLAHRDAEWLAPVYSYLGITVDCIQEGMTIKERQAGYRADVTYLTARESGFDYLRDNLCYHPNQRVQRPFHFAIVDEADSILIDEARIPLVLAGSEESRLPDMLQLAELARAMREYRDFEFDEYARTVSLTGSGIRMAEKSLQCGNLFTENNLELLTRLNSALYAEYLVQRDVDYIVRDGIVELVDDFTGRVADKRRWPDGLQAAIETKEHVTIRDRGKVLNSITLQHFINLYPKLSGMTATAQTAEEEFREIYDLHVVIVPPNRPCIRQDHPDKVFPDKETKYQSLIKEIISVQTTGQPVLVGTRHVRESEQFVRELQNQGIICEVLNARNDEREAQIIASAGRLGAVTISTNMAGRGIDIRLGGKDEVEKQQVMALGGLYVIGTNRHESTRIDDQLRGRAGRQEEPGLSRYFISLEDDLYEKYRLNELIPKRLLRMNNSQIVENPVVIRELERIQRIIEGQNLAIKKYLLKYSALIEQQRQIHFDLREQYLMTDKTLDMFLELAPSKAHICIDKSGKDVLLDFCRQQILKYMDTAWNSYLAELENLQEGIYLNSLGGKVPVVEYYKFAISRFETMQQETAIQIHEFLSSIRSGKEGPATSLPEIQAPSSTWTYMVNDNPFEKMIGVQLAGNTAMSFAYAMMWPLVLGAEIAKKVMALTKEK